MVHFLETEQTKTGEKSLKSDEEGRFSGEYGFMPVFTGKGTLNLVFNKWEYGDLVEQHRINLSPEETSTLLDFLGGGIL